MVRFSAHTLRFHPQAQKLGTKKYYFVLRKPLLVSFCIFFVVVVVVRNIRNTK